MNKRILIVIGLVILVGAAVYGLTRDKKSPTTNTSSTSSTTSPPPSSSSTNSTTQPASTSGSITIQSFAFGPAQLTVKKGATVTWTNQDSVAHTVTETDSQTGPASGDLANGAKYSFTYNTVGTFHYHCSIHTDMTGSVIVTE